MNKHLLFVLLALVVLVSGFVKAVGVVGETKTYKARIAAKEKRLATLKNMQSRTPTSTDLERADLESPDALRKLVDVYLDGQLTSVQSSRVKAIESGWEQHSAEVRITNVPWSVLARFLEKAGNHRHPWRLAGYDLTPSPEGGTGTLRFESLVRKPQGRASNG